MGTRAVVKERPISSSEFEAENKPGETENWIHVSSHKIANQLSINPVTSEPVNLVTTIQ